MCVGGRGVGVCVCGGVCHSDENFRRHLARVTGNSLGGDSTLERISLQIFKGREGWLGLQGCWPLCLRAMDDVRATGVPTEYPWGYTP
ncbi:hypothetical protein CEXT_628951 [Caerostris extrusa]|uniref:Uncharacterized protein n=1 Tax=Caerostris extrusa TaxID=172846 RepID=A0AAV4X8A3_CAEEX|nr:hypothetical protein CEXT_628951 [Caerostris extrusa]